MMSKCATCQLVCWLGDVAFSQAQDSDVKILCFACVPSTRTYKGRGLTASEITQVVTSEELDDLKQAVDR